MTTTIYWACIEKEWMLAQAPDLVSSLFYRNKGKNKTGNDPSAIQYCPAFNDNLKNVFALRSLYNYEFFVDGSSVYSKDFDQKFFNDHVVARSLEERFFSFKNSYIFFTEDPSLEVTFYEYPFLEDNNITNNCMPVSGKFDIGKWFRNTEFAFYLKQSALSFKIDQGEIYSYMRVHTKDKIQFKQFRFTDKLKEYQNDGFYLNNVSIKLGKLENYYKYFKNKNLILKEIKSNLI